MGEILPYSSGVFLKICIGLRRCMRQLLLPPLTRLVHSIVFKTPFVWGDPKRVHISGTAIMINTLFNTSSGEITVGEFTFASHNVCIITGTHNHFLFLDARIKSFPKEGRDIIIGKGVWLGSNCTILGPCIISDHVVVAAGAVVVPGSFLEEGGVYGGIPAKKISSTME